MNSPLPSADERTNVTPIDRYEPVRTVLPDTLPALTRVEAERAAGKLWRKFAPKRWKARGYTFRRSWVSKVPTDRADNRDGWGSLIHDISHELFWRHYPNRRPHDPLHAKYEADVAAHVSASGWLAGTLKPKPKAKLTLDQKRMAELVRSEAAIGRWTSKAKRAATALRKLNAKRRRLLSLLSSDGSAKR